ncbi:MAG TPA: Ig domain-containing protein [Candidatus Limnocylindrales bacterium]|nr:Ig domain-containing protein [Candidatus Limnocylindrales bacterium]
MFRLRWFRTATVTALALSVVAFGAAWPAQATQAQTAASEATAAPAAAAPAGMIGKSQPVTVTKATIEEIQATAARGNGQLFTLSAGAGVSAIITCTLAISPPFGGGSPGASVQVDAALQCTDWMDFVSLYVELWRDLGQVATSGAAVPLIPALYVSAKETTCKYGIYWGVATGFVRRSGYTFVPSPWLHVHSVPLPVGCGSAPPPPPPPPSGTVTVTNPGNQYMYVWDTAALQMRATGGTGTYAWSANGLPPGLTINPSTGLITGTARTTGTYTVTVTAAAGIGNTAFTNFTWNVRREPCPHC